MPSKFCERISDHSHVQAIWRSQTESIERITIGAKASWDIVSVRGPKDNLRRVMLSAPCRFPQELEVGVNDETSWFLGIRFAPGVYMPARIAARLDSQSMMDLPIRERSFSIDGESFLNMPVYGNAEVLADQLIEAGLLMRDRVICEVLEAPDSVHAKRSLQRRFINRTSMSRMQLTQLQRAEYAETLILRGFPGSQVAALAGYADQSHMIRQFKLLFGRTPGTIHDGFSD